MPQERKGNLELIEASMVRLAELIQEHGSMDNLVENMDLPFDKTTAAFFMPTIEELITLSSMLVFESGEIGGENVMAMGISEDFAGHIAAMQARSFLMGYISAKMESGDL